MAEKSRKFHAQDPGRRAGTSTRLRTAVVIVFVAGLVTWVSTAWAGVARGQDGGNSVTVGAMTSPSSSSTSPRGSPTTHGGTGSSGPSCTYTAISLSEGAGFDLAPGGPTAGEWYLVQCPGSPALEQGRAEWVPTPKGAPSAPLAVATASPVGAAMQAAASMALPSPSVVVNPAAFSVVNLPTWLSIDPTWWHPFQATATAGGVTATAVATPETVSWTMGDGGAVECQGPGTGYDPDLPADTQSTSCSYTYARSSVGEPSSDGNSNDGAFSVTATVTWKVTWTAVGAPGGGTLPPLQTSSTLPLRVEQVESVGVAQ